MNSSFAQDESQKNQRQARYIQKNKEFDATYKYAKDSIDLPYWVYILFEKAHLELDYSHYPKCYKNIVELDSLFSLPELKLTYDKLGETYQNAFIQYQIALEVLKGNYFFNIGDWNKAEHIFQGLVDSKKNYAHFYLILQNLGTIKKFQKNYEQAIEYFEESLKSKTIQGQKKALSYKHLGDIIYQSKNDYKIAKEYYHIADSILAKISQGENASSSKLMSTRTALHTAIAYMEGKESNFDEAFKNIEKIKIINQQNSNIEDDVYFKKGEIFRLHPQTNLTQAKANYESALKLRIKKFGQHHHKVAEIYHALGLVSSNFDEAISNNNSALKFLFPEGKSFDTNFNPSNSQIELVDNLPLLLKILHQKVIAQNEKAKTSKKMPTQAWQTLKVALNVIDTIRVGVDGEQDKLLALQENYPIFELALEILFDLGAEYHTSAFDVIEKSKSIILNEAIYHSKAIKYSGLSEEIRNQEFTLKKEIQNLKNSKDQNIQNKVLTESNFVENNLSKKKKEYRKLLENLKKNNTRFYDLKYNTKSISLDDTKNNLLDSKTSLIEFFVGKNSVFVFVLNQNANPVFKKISTTTNELNRLCNNFRKEINHGRESSYQNLGHQLYQILIHDFKDILQPNLIFIPDGILATLPFESLITDDENLGSRNHNKISFLQKKHHVSYCYSANLLREFKSEKIDNLSFLGLAPLFDKKTSNLDPIINNVDEVKRIGNLFSEPKILLSEFAKKDSFLVLAPKNSIIHIATHGVLNNNNSDDSFIAFTPDSLNKTEFKLFVKDLYASKLEAAMVTLSACQTAEGTYQQGEGIMSMSRAFSYAGAKSLVTTLWEVNAESTSKLMTDFYSNLKRGDTKSKSLWKVKNDMLATTKYSHPKYWAGCIIIGDYSPIFIKKGWPLFVKILLPILLLLIGFYFLKR